MTDNKIPNNDENDLCTLLTKIDEQIDDSLKDQLTQSLDLLDAIMMRQGIENNNLLKRTINDLTTMIDKYQQKFAYKIHWKNNISATITHIKVELGCIEKQN